MPSRALNTACAASGRHRVPEKKDFRARVARSGACLRPPGEGLSCARAPGAGRRQPVIDKAELTCMSRRERARLMRALAALEHPRMAGPGRKRRRRLFLAGIIVCCVVLAVQIRVLALTLPRYYPSGDRRGAWVVVARPLL